MCDKYNHNNIEVHGINELSEEDIDLDHKIEDETDDECNEPPKKKQKIIITESIATLKICNKTKRIS